MLRRRSPWTKTVGQILDTLAAYRQRIADSRHWSMSRTPRPVDNCRATTGGSCTLMKRPRARSRVRTRHVPHEDRLRGLQLADHPRPRGEPPAVGRMTRSHPPTSASEPMSAPTARGLVDAAPSSSDSRTNRYPHAPTCAVERPRSDSATRSVRCKPADRASERHARAAPPVLSSEAERRCLKARLRPRETPRNPGTTSVVPDPV
jgi:hypothetical protein